MNKKAYGFTIVELLIVIVVIAILAAVAVVAYNGIQQRSYNTKIISGATSYQKSLLQYKAINSTYPNVSGCLGANYPSNQCWQGPNGTWSVNSGLDNLLQEFVSSKPTIATELMPIHTGTDSRAGVLYLYTNATDVKLIYYLKGAGQSCTLSGATANTEANTTQCSLPLTN